MTRRVRVTILGVLAVCGVLVPAARASARTTVVVKDKVVTIKVSVDVFGADALTGPDGQPLVDYWEKIAEDTWNAAFDRYPYCNRYKLRLDVDLRARSRDADDRAGRHRLHVTAPRGGTDWQGVGWNGVPETNPQPGSGDGTRSFNNDRVGTIPANAPPTIIVHEFGHLLGLGDDRKDGVATSGRDGTVMVGGVAGVDPTKPLRIDKELVDRIGTEITKIENEVSCKVALWEGTTHGTNIFPTFIAERGDVVCHVTVDGRFNFAVAPDGKVTGTSTTQYDGYDCDGYSGTTPTPFFGNETARGFSVSTFVAGTGGPTQFRRTGDRAHGTYAVHNADNDYEYTFDVHCVNCDDVNVS